MKLSFIFPPQWDPRQPPLSIPSLIGALNAEKIKTELKVWDLNLALYAELLCTNKENLIKLREYLAPEALADPRKYRRLEKEIEDVILNSYDICEDKDFLLLDMYKSKYSATCSADWKSAIDTPEILPLIAHLKFSFQEIVQWQPDVVAISTFSDTQIINSLAIASILKRKLPRSRFVIGGSPFIERTDFINKVKFLFDVFSCVCVGDGEPTILAICQEEAMNKIPNIIWRDNENNLQINKIEKYTFPINFTSDFSKLDIQSYLTPSLVIPVETSRGCYWGKCVFCNHPTLYKNNTIYQTRPITQIINELKSHKKNGVNNFFFVDEAIPASRLRKISQEIIITKLDINWIAYCRLDKNIDLNTLTIAKLAGLRKIFFGLESGSDKLLHLVNKGTNSAVSKKVISIASKIGISVHLFLIGGFPTESEYDFNATLELIKSISKTIDPFGFTYNFFPLTCGYGTEAFSSREKIGATQIIVNNHDDMATRYFFTPSYASDRKFFLERKDIVGKTIKKLLGEKSVLADCNFTNDSTHLLAINQRILAEQAAQTDRKKRGGLA